MVIPVNRLVIITLNLEQLRSRVNTERNMAISIALSAHVLHSVYKYIVVTNVASTHLSVVKLFARKFHSTAGEFMCFSVYDTKIIS